jgi:predicted amidohydrolase YtcJ
MNTIADKADLIFTGGRVHTMDVGDRFVEAVAIAGNRIVAAGSDRDVLALKHTINGAYASFEETRKGSIEVGKLADLVMLDEDIAQVPSENLAQVPVAMTIGGGKVVHEASL